MRWRLLAAGAVALLGASCIRPPSLPVPTPVPGARVGGTLVVGIGEPSTVDPQATDAHDPYQRAVVDALCDTLVAVDPATGELRPAIAESWQATAGGARLTLKLRRGVRFHDGRELTSTDAAFALSRLASEDFASPVASLMEAVRGYDVLRGEEEAADERQRRFLRGVRTPERFGLEINLEGRFGDFVRTLAHPATAPVSEQAATSDPAAFSRRPVCAGPYQMSEPWMPAADTITLHRFEDYYGANTAYSSGGSGYADRVEFRIFDERESQVAAFRAGLVQVAHVSDSMWPQREDFGADLVTATTPTLEYVGLPAGTDPFSARGVRLAMSQVLDRRELSRELWAGVREPATGFFPPATGEMHRAGACVGFAPPTADLAGARESLRRAGVEGLEGLEVPFHYNDEFGHRSLVDAVAERWRATLGIETQPVGLPWDSHLQTGMGQPGFTGPFRMSWAPQVPSADGYVEPLFGASSIGLNNFSRFADRAFDRRLVNEARRAVAADDVVAAYQSLEDVLCGEMPVIPVAWGARAYLVDATTLGSGVAPVSVGWGTIVLRELYVR